MAKRVLAIYFTQTGQLEEVVNSFLKPFERDEAVEVEQIRVFPKQAYPFPWSGKEFFGAMPDSVLGNPQELKDIPFKSDRYDLVIFAYQPWFLSPSIPATSVLKYESVKSRIRNADVVTLIGARNMWLNAQEKVKDLLNEAGARLIANVALVDRSNNLASAVSIVRWLLGGKKDRFLGIFPKPGISDKDIALAESYGKIVLSYRDREDEQQLQPELVEAGAVEVRDNIMFIESRAGKLFTIWAKHIDKQKNRELWLKVFKYYLFFALFIVSPIVLLINAIFIKPLTIKARQAQKNYYLGLKKDRG